jgi:hypothetical protein
MNIICDEQLIFHGKGHMSTKCLWSRVHKVSVGPLPTTNKQFHGQRQSSIKRTNTISYDHLIESPIIEMSRPC